MKTAFLAAMAFGVVLFGTVLDAEAAKVRYYYSGAPAVHYYGSTPPGVTAIYPGAIPVTTYYAPNAYGASYGSGYAPTGYGGGPVVAGYGVVQAGYAPAVVASPGYAVTGPVVVGPRRTTFYGPAPVILRGAPVMIYPIR